jgi:hypothetical protein
LLATPFAAIHKGLRGDDMKTVTGDKSARDKRLVEALRHNLRRRKAQSRERAQNREAPATDPANTGDEPGRNPSRD